MEQPAPARPSLLSSPRTLFLLGLAFCLVWGGAFVAHEVRTPGLVDANGVAVGRDFLTFYGAGRLVLQGKGEALLDGGQQQAVQAAVLRPQAQVGFYYFVYPPFLAGIYAPLAALPYRLSFYAHVALMLLCFLAGCLLLRRHLPRLSPCWGAAVALGLSSFPMIHTILGGQNAALSFLLLCGFFAALDDGRPRRAGALLGLQLFKPQLALPLCGLLLLRGQGTALATLAAVALVEYLASAVLAGWRWPIAMARSLGGYYRVNERQVSGQGHLALPEVIDFSLVRPLERAGCLEAARVAAWLGPASALALLGWAAVRCRKLRLRAPQLGPTTALWVALTLLVSLHTQHYEAALLVLPVLLLLDENQRRGRPLALAHRLMLLLSYALFPFLTVLGAAQRLRFQPLLLLPLWVLDWARRSLAAGDPSVQERAHG